MEIPVMAAATAALEQPASVFVAVELSKARWLVGIHSPIADRISRHSVAGGDSRALLELITRARRQAEARLARPVAVVSSYEAGYDGFWLHRLLLAEGVASHVIDPAGLAVHRRARRAKTDRIDLGALLRALLAWHRGEQQVCRMVRVPSPEDEDRRRRRRERARLISERVQQIGRIKGLLMTQGIREFEPAGRDGLERLSGLRCGDGRPVPPALAAEIERECRRLWLVIAMVKAVEAERAEADAPEAAGQAARLTRLAGIGPVAAHVRSTKRAAATSPTGARWRASSASRRAPTAAARSGATRGSAAPATRGRGGRRSSSPGCGCATNRAGG